ncbi:UNVERIFIED_CONTAM: hypothetical protein FKN15_033381 [Acipenser sinensis]
MSLPPPPAEGEYLLVPPTPPWEDCMSLPPPPAEGEYLLVPPTPPWEDCMSLPPPPAEGESLLVPPTPPWEDCMSLPPPPAEGEYLLVPPPPLWEDCVLFPPPPAEGEYLPVPPPPPWEDCVSLSPPPAEGEYLLSCLRARAAGESLATTWSQQCYMRHGPRGEVDRLRDEAELQVKKQERDQKMLREAQIAMGNIEHVHREEMDRARKEKESLCLELKAEREGAVRRLQQERDDITAHCEAEKKELKEEMGVLQQDRDKSLILAENNKQALSLKESEKMLLAEKLANAQQNLASITMEMERMRREALSCQEQDKEGSVRSAGSTTMEPLNCKTVPVKMIAQPGLSERPGVAGRPGLQK